MKLKFLTTVQYRDPKFTRNNDTKTPAPPLETYIAGQTYNFDGNKHKTLTTEFLNKHLAEKYTEPDPIKVETKDGSNDKKLDSKES